MKTCLNCGKEISKESNYCDWNCMVALATKEGGKIIAPNDQPIACIRHDGTMLEHEHADHPSYKFPVDVEYVGEVTQQEIDEFSTAHGTSFTEAQVRKMNNECHALIYSDGNVALTLHECTYSLWRLDDGLSLWSGRDSDKCLSVESLKKISKVGS